MRWVLMGIMMGALLLGACAGEEDRESVPKDSASPVPTLDIEAIPVLGEPDPPPPVPLPVDDARYPIQPLAGEEIAVGKALYEQFCAACHGVEGEGEQPDPYAPGAAPPHNEAGHTWHHADQQNFSLVWSGREFNGLMPGYHDRMTPDEIIQVLAYIKIWWTDDQLAHQLTLSQQVIDGVSG